MKQKTAILLVNLGTPDNAQTPAVRRYLREFLSDGRVIDINPIGRYVLVNGIIAPFRAPKSAKAYKKIWDENGSPLMYYSVRVKELLAQKLGDQFVVELAMRYQNPSLALALERIRKQNVAKIVIVPLFPQYASATTGSIHQKVMQIIGQWQLIPALTFISSYPDFGPMIDVFVKHAQKHIATHTFEHYIFSYHGLPARQITKADPTGKCLAKDGSCCAVLHEGNALCYKAQCEATSRKLAEKLGISDTQYTTCFQSRLGKTVWIQPYTEDVIKQLAEKNIKNVLVFSPAFVADCLETIEEIGQEYKEQFEHLGGQHWQLVESLNDDPQWVDALSELIMSYLPETTHQQTTSSI